MKNVILKIIGFYQKTFSPDHGFVTPGAMRCRYWPSCSEYTRQAVDKYGVWRGIKLGFGRILRCHPFSPGGVDELK